jgi:hypothetical protein
MLPDAAQSSRPPKAIASSTERRRCRPDPCKVSRGGGFVQAKLAMALQCRGALGLSAIERIEKNGLAGFAAHRVARLIRQSSKQALRVVCIGKREEFHCIGHLGLLSRDATVATEHPPHIRWN